jgi:uncharacterized membrane protein YgaE (UPF0421/DUF939 family)
MLTYKQHITHRSNAMTHYYEVREVQPVYRCPQDKGTIISFHRTFAEAMAAATKLDAAGRKVEVRRSEGWEK